MESILSREPIMHARPQPAEGTIRVKAIENFKGSIDGQTLIEYHEGEEYDLPAGPWPRPDLAVVAIQEGWAEEVKIELSEDADKSTDASDKQDEPKADLPRAETPKAEQKSMSKAEYKAKAKQAQQA